MALDRLTCLVFLPLSGRDDEFLGGRNRLLTISQTAYGNLANDSYARWLEWAVRAIIARHPQWGTQQGVERLQALCARLESFSQQYSLERPESFMALVDYEVESGRELQPTAYQDHVLRRPGFSEALRVERFLADLRSGSRLRLIELAGIA